MKQSTNIALRDALARPMAAAMQTPILLSSIERVLAYSTIGLAGCWAPPGLSEGLKNAQPRNQLPDIGAKETK